MTKIRKMKKLPLHIQLELMSTLELRKHLNVTDGLDGTNGTDGKAGSSGSQGTSGTDGTNGKDGKDGGLGPRGSEGTRGSNGRAGLTGSKGDPGLKGLTGKTGKNGLTGKAGKTGTTGKTGKAGKAGQNGLKGTDAYIDMEALTKSLHSHDSIVNVEIEQDFKGAKLVLTRADNKKIVNSFDLTVSGSRKVKERDYLNYYHIINKQVVTIPDRVQSMILGDRDIEGELIVLGEAVQI